MDSTRLRRRLCRRRISVIPHCCRPFSPLIAQMDCQPSVRQAAIYAFGLLGTRI